MKSTLGGDVDADNGDDDVENDDADNADDLAVLSCFFTDGLTLLHHLEKNSWPVHKLPEKKFLCYNQYHSETIKTTKMRILKLSRTSLISEVALLLQKKTWRLD